MNLNTKMYTLSGNPYYDNIKQCYRKILVINKEPDGPLRKICTRIKNTPPSPFKAPSVCCTQPTCIWVVGTPNNYMCIDELPNLFQFLIENGYTINTQITEMMERSVVKMDGNLICFISYNS
tara:strand:+ start:1534 stop:1899 length:366 start_codon:yes stop_codon:yes gene_type:complete